MIPEDLEPSTAGLEYYIDAFQELNSCRPQGFGIAPIPFTAIHQYCTLYEIEDTDEFLYLIRRMDNTLLSLESDRKESTNAKGHSH